jgi:anti-sigma-K factor RskA
MNAVSKEVPERQEVEALLPWHAAGTLNRRDRERVERAIAADHELARCLMLVREEQQETIHLNESLGVPSARAMEKLFAAIEAEGAQGPARRSFDLAGRIAGFLSSFSPRTVAYAAAAATVALFLQAAVLTSLVVKDQPGENIELASAKTNSNSHAVVRFAAQATSSEIVRFLNVYGAEVVDGPTKTSSFKIRFAGKPSEADILKTVQRMQADTKMVEFIALTE